MPGLLKDILKYIAKVTFKTNFIVDADMRISSLKYEFLHCAVL
jgi:hypothetical protein